MQLSGDSAHGILFAATGFTVRATRRFFASHLVAINRPGT